MVYKYSSLVLPVEVLAGRLHASGHQRRSAAEHSNFGHLAKETYNLDGLRFQLMRKLMLPRNLRPGVPIGANPRKLESSGARSALWSAVP